ncbi:sel1 repeat family protein, partial [Pseudomonas syringae]|nr:sel1 repeat family protein [Pseudomonas syringae]
MNAEARSWYEKSANQGDLYAMIQLGRSKEDLCKLLDECGTTQKKPIEWLNQAKGIAEKKATTDAESMYIMYELTVDEKWLMKAATGGNAEAQYWVAVGYKQGEGFFLPWTRAKEVEKWFKLSAEGGYPKSMMEYGALLYEKGDVEGFRKWSEKAALAGYPDSVYGYGAYLSHEPD